MIPMCPLDHLLEKGSCNSYSYIHFILMSGDQSSEKEDIHVLQEEAEPPTMSGEVDYQRIQDIISTLNSLSLEFSHVLCSSRDNVDALDSSAEYDLQLGECDNLLNNSTDRSKEQCFEYNRAKYKTVRLNVSGKVFTVEWNVLLRIPDSRLGRLAMCTSLSESMAYCDKYNPRRNEFYFEHRHQNLTDILNYYRTNLLHISNDCCVIAFVQDLHYWGLSEEMLEPCCLKRYVETKENLEWDTPEASNEAEVETFPDTAYGRIQNKIWDVFEHPHTSIFARVIGIISLSCIFISTVILTLETLPYFQDHEDQILGEFSVFAIVEAVYMAWFTLEFIARIACCPSKVDFIKKTMNWIDLLAIIPYFVTVTLHSYGVHDVDHVEGYGGDEAGSGDVSRTAQYFRLLKIARIVKTLRIIRIFKLARHSTGLQALGNTMRANYKELGLLFLLLGMGAIMFASLIYVFEKEDNHSTFKTMFDAYWWAIITMTTVGYGDVSPATGFGKVLGCFCAIFGVLVIALPIPIIGNSFNRFYARQKRWEKDGQQQLNKKSGVDINRQGKEMDGLSFRGL